MIEILIILPRKANATRILELPDDVSEIKAFDVERCYFYIIYFNNKGNIVVQRY